MTRRSWASGALESSIDWFWHTTQRSSCEIPRARASSAASLSFSPGSTAWTGERAMKMAASATAKWRMANGQWRIAGAREATRHSPFAIRPFPRIASLRRRRRRHRVPARAAPGRADPQAAVEKGEGAAERHHHGAEPDQPDQRMEIGAHDEGAVGQCIAEHDVEVAAPGGVDAGFGGGLARGLERALGGRERRDRRAIAGHAEAAQLLAVVRA